MGQKKTRIYTLQEKCLIYGQWVGLHMCSALEEFIRVMEIRLQALDSNVVLITTT